MAHASEVKPHSFKICGNITHPSRARSCTLYVTLRFSDQDVMCLAYFCIAYCYTLLDLIVLIIFGGKSTDYETHHNEFFFSQLLHYSPHIPIIYSPSP
jgi:hypothetical protein